jgi:hypothetical protein
MLALVCVPPSALVDSEQFSKFFRSLYLAYGYPAMYFTIVEAKEQPFQDVMARKISSLGMKEKLLLMDGVVCFDKVTQIQAAKLMYRLEIDVIKSQQTKVYKNTQQLCMKALVRRFFNQGSNLNSMHHMGWLARSQATKKIIKVVDCRRGIPLGDMGNHYKVLPFDANVHVAQYQERHRLAVSIINALPPKNFQEYEKLITGFSYHDKWTPRSMISPACQHAGLGHLHIPVRDHNLAKSYFTTCNELSLHNSFICITTHGISYNCEICGCISR